MKPKCPWCGRELGFIGENLTGERWGCDPCLLYVNKGKPQPQQTPALRPISEIAESLKEKYYGPDSGSKQHD